MQLVSEQSKSTSGDLTTRYEQTPYVSAAFAPWRPDNLSVVAALGGLTPVPVEGCRVLELGCASGGNLLPMAHALPGSQFVGIDLSPKAIELGTAQAERAGLRNVELRCQDILEFSDPQPFDYIIAHGFYSWAPQEARDRAMQLCGQSLSPSGVAYFSYNTLPGWHARQIARDMMLFHVRGKTNSSERIAAARQMMALAAAHPPPAPTPQAAAVKLLAANVASSPDWLLEHDDLGMFTHPVYFEEFVRHASSHGLEYVGGAQPQMNVFFQLPYPVRKTLLGFTTDSIALEQYADFVWGTQYRDSILCRRDADRSQKRGPQSIDSLQVAACLIEQPPASADGNQIRFVNPLKRREIGVSEPASVAVLRMLGRTWPNTVPFAELLQEAGKTPGGPPAASLGQFLSDQIFAGYVSGILELWTRPADFIAAAPPSPCVAPPARLAAESNGPIVNLRHEECRFSDSFVRDLIRSMDGSRDRSALMDELLRISNRLRSRGNRAVVANDATLDAVLSTLARHSLFWNPPNTLS